ncbi:Cation efflux system protein CusB, partial [termite gut metagenome]
MKKIIIIWVWLPVLCACGGSPGSDDASDKQYTVEGDRITVPEESPILQYIKTQKVQTTDYRATFTASGTVQAIPSLYAEIATPFSGRIVKSFIHLGQRVS